MRVTFVLVADFILRLLVTALLTKPKWEIVLPQ